MSSTLLPALNCSERLIGAEALQCFVDASWRSWTHCSGMKRPFVWQCCSRRAYRKLVERNQDIMLDMLARGDVEDCFVFSKNIGLVHRIKRRRDFCATIVEQLPLRRLLFAGNGSLRGGMIFRGGVTHPEFKV